MSTKKTKSALLLAAATSAVSEQKVSGLQRRTEQMDTDSHKHQHQPTGSNTLRIKLDHLKSFDPLTDNQKKFFDAYKRGDYFIGLLGSAGVGKTFIAMYKALEEVLDKSNPFKQVVVVRSAVQGREQGFLPGTLDEKQAIYEQPYLEVCTTLFGRPDAWERLKEQEHARFISTTAIRGISIDDAIIIVDECQNMSWGELSTVMTRTGYRSKILFVGDWKQNDLVRSKYDVSGMLDFLKVARNMKDFTEVEFNVNDIVRSSLVRDWIISCEEMGF